MAAMRSGMAVICAVLALVAAACTAARTAPAPAADCSSLVLTMADCLTFVMAGSTTKKPEGTCCSGLKSVLKSNAECLCEAFRNSAQLGVTLNVTKAMTLPAACHVSAPSVSNCGLSTGAGDAPALPPSSAVSPSPSSVAEPPSSGSVGVNEVFVPAPAPAAASTVSGASSLMASMAMLVLAAAAAASFSLF